MNTSYKKPNPIIKLDDESLFGNDAADLEQEALFYSYAVERSELSEFLNPENAIQVARAYKGEGKSGLLRLVNHKLINSQEDQLVITAIGPDHSPVISDNDSDLWTREWKKTLVTIPRQSRGPSLCEPLKAAMRGR